MKNSFFIAFLTLGFMCNSFAQISGNSVQNSSSNRNVNFQAYRTNHQVVANDSLLFLKVKVLKNFKADSYVAVFGVADTATTVLSANQQINARINGFKSKLIKSGVPSEDIYVDITTQTQIYDYNVKGSVARQYLNGFELKKNVSIAFTEKEQMESFMLMAAEYKIYDLVKVDYIIENMGAIKDALFDEAISVIKKKKKRYTGAMGIDVSKRSRILTEGYTTLYPTNLYQQYTSNASTKYHYTSSFSKKLDVLKTPTYYFDGLENSDFDSVNDPVLLEPVVQCIIQLQMSYEILE